MLLYGPQGILPSFPHQSNENATGPKTARKADAFKQSLCSIACTDRSTPILRCLKSISWCVQAHEAGVQLGQQELHQQRLLNHKLEKALQGKASQQQAAADKEAAAAVQAAAHVASLEKNIQQLKVTPTRFMATALSKHDGTFMLPINFEYI